MTAPAGTDVVASSALVQAEPWARFALLRGWAAAGNPAFSGADFDRIRALHFPRPQVYADGMRGELQDVYATARVHVGTDDVEMRHRQVIFEESLDGENRVRIAGASRRIALPLYGRVHIRASFSHRIWITGPYGGPTLTDPVGYFALYWSLPDGTPKEIVGSRRYTARYTPNATAASINTLLAPSLTTVCMIGVLDTSGAAGVAPGASDVEVFVAFCASPSTFFGGGRTSMTKNNDRLDVLNTSLVVRVYKNSVS